MRGVFLISLFSNLLNFCVGNLDNDISTIISNLTTGYNRLERPNYGEKRVTVGLTLYILSISELSHTNMDFHLMYLRQFWHDPRLAFGQSPSADRLVLGAEIIKSIWSLDTFFVNAKETHIHREHTDNQFLRIIHNGYVLRSMRIAVKASCPLNTQHFTMDIQMCHLEIESLWYTMADLEYRWEENQQSVQLTQDIALPDFKVLGHRQRLIKISLTSGNYSRLILNVLFERDVGLYVVHGPYGDGVMACLVAEGSLNKDSGVFGQYSLCHHYHIIQSFNITQDLTRPGNNSRLSGSPSQFLKTFCPIMSKISLNWSKN